MQTTQNTKAAPATIATPVKVAGRPRTNAVATYQKPLFLSIRGVQKYYFPMLSLKHIRKIGFVFLIILLLDIMSIHHHFCR